MKNIIVSPKGFTLLEILIAMTILGIVLTGVVKIFSGTSGHHTAQQAMMEVTQDIRAVKQLMTYELRLAGCNPDGLKRMGFQLDSSDDRLDTDENSIHFWSDIDNGDGDEFLEPDGDALDTGEDIAYYRIDSNNNVLSSSNKTVGTLVRNAGGVIQPVMDNVTDLQFSYRDANDNAITVFDNEKYLDDIKSVGVAIERQVRNPEQVSRSNRTWRLEFTVLVRNSGS